MPIKHAFNIKNDNIPKSINVRKRNNNWEYRFEAPKTLDGKRHWVSKCGFNSRSEAFENAIQKIREVYVHQLDGVQNLVDKM
jgi:hypothetical protein